MIAWLTPIVWALGWIWLAILATGLILLLGNLAGGIAQTLIVRHERVKQYKALFGEHPAHVKGRRSW